MHVHKFVCYFRKPWNMLMCVQNVIQENFWMGYNNSKESVSPLPIYSMSNTHVYMQICGWIIDMAQKGC
jgi:hypothetical protein